MRKVKIKRSAHADAIADVLRGLADQEVAGKVRRSADRYGNRAKTRRLVRTPADRYVRKDLVTRAAAVARKRECVALREDDDRLVLRWSSGALSLATWATEWEAQVVFDRG